MRSRRKTISWSIAFTSTNKMWLRLKHNQDLFWGAKNWVCWKQDSDWGPGSADTIMVISNYLCTWPTVLQLSPWHLLEHSITMTQWVPFWWTDTHEWHCLYIYNPNYNLHNYFVLPSFRTILWSPLSATRLHPIPSMEHICLWSPWWSLESFCNSHRLNGYEPYGNKCLCMWWLPP